MTLLLDDFQSFIASSLYGDAEFTNFCTTEVGQQLNFYQDSDVKESSEERPCLIVHKLMSDDDKKNQQSWQLEIQVIVSTDNKPIQDEGVWVFQTPRKVEKITSKAIERIECLLRDLGISDGVKTYKDIFIDRIVTAISELGTDDVRSVVFIEFGRHIYLNK